MFSMITAPPTRIGNCRPQRGWAAAARPISPAERVTTGMRAFLMVCRIITTRSLSPLDQAVRIWSWRSTSSIMVRVIRMVSQEAVVPRIRQGMRNTTRFPSGSSVSGKKSLPPAGPEGGEEEGLFRSMAYCPISFFRSWSNQRRAKMTVRSIPPRSTSPLNPLTHGWLT